MLKLNVHKVERDGLSSVVKNKSEDVMLNVERVSARPQHKVLHEGLGRVVVGLKLSEHIDKDASIEHGVTVYGRDEVLDLLEGEGGNLLHDLHSPLHLLAFKGH